MDTGFCDFPQSLQINARMLLLLGYYRILPNPFQFIIYVSFYHLTLQGRTIGHRKENYFYGENS
jgi:hypothetical protein